MSNNPVHAGQLSDTYGASCYIKSPGGTFDVDIDGVRTVTHHSTDAERRGVIESLVADGVDRDTVMESYKGCYNQG